MYLMIESDLHRPLIPGHFHNMLPLSCKKLSRVPAAEECYFLLFRNLDLSFLLLLSVCVHVTFLMTPLCALCGVEWEQWEWEDHPFNLWREEKN